MPELPEVETVRRGLGSAIANANVVGVVVRDRRLRWPIPKTFERDLIGCEILRIERRSKYLLFRLRARDDKTEKTLLAHLGMTGSFVVIDSKQLPSLKAHDHVDIALSNGLTLRYNDPRRFGSMHVFEGDDATQPLLAHLGPEPLTDAFNADYLFEHTRRRPGPIKQAIMDNTLVVGVGNIYANESLFRAGIHPNRAANRISKPRYESLVREIKAVLSEAIKAGGSTLRDYVNANGEPGYFQLNYFVYGRDGEPCKHCGTILKLMRHGGRATVYCTRCQR
jgi:formamidopyrimidine-DNA glycosylase